MGIYDNTVASRSRNQQLKEIALQGDQDLLVGFGERFTHANKLTFQRHTNTGQEKVFEEKYAQRDQILKDAGLIEKDLLTTQRLIDRSEAGNRPFLNDNNFLGIGEKQKDILGMPDFDEFLRDNEKYDELLNDFISAHPELNILSDEQIRSEVAMDQFELLNRDQDLAERSTWLGKAGYLAGSMVGWLRDPVNSSSSLLGLSSVGRLTMAQNFLRVGSTEAILTGILEFKRKPSELEFRKEFGEPDLTVSDVEKEAILASAGSFVLGGGIGSLVGRFVRGRSRLKIAESETNNNNVTEGTQDLVDAVRARQAAGESFDIQVEQATDLLDEALQIARAAPKDTSYERHMTNYASARKAVAEGLDVKGADEFSQTVRGSDQRVEAPDGSQTAIPESTIDVQNRAITGLRTELNKNDVLTNTAGTEGGAVNISSREILDNLDAQDAAVRATIDCLG